MSIGLASTCLQCNLNRNLDLAKTLGTEEQTMAFARRLMQMYLDAPAGVSAPWFNPEVSDILHEMYGLPIDRFKEEKAFSNRFVLERLDQIRAKVEFAEDPVFAGLQFSILGNYLDFSALQGKVSFETLEDMLSKGLEMVLEGDNYGALCADLEKGKKLLYLTDNAGEIVFDRVFLEVIRARFPELSITVCVRGGPAQNDATIADAKAVGMPFRVIGNGTRIPGTVLELASDELKAALTTADVILAKGQANVETLLDTGHGYNVYYAFLVKCKRFIDRFGKAKLTPMLVRDKD